MGVKKKPTLKILFRQFAISLIVMLVALPLLQQSAEHRALAYAGWAGNNKRFSSHDPSPSCSFGLNRSGGSADKITWSLSIIKMDAVLRP